MIQCRSPYFSHFTHCSVLFQTKPSVKYFRLIIMTGHPPLRVARTVKSITWNIHTDSSWSIYPVPWDSVLWTLPPFPAGAVWHYVAYGKPRSLGKPCLTLSLNWCLYCIMLRTQWKQYTDKHICFSVLNLVLHHICAGSDWMKFKIPSLGVAVQADLPVNWTTGLLLIISTTPSAIC